MDELEIRSTLINNINTSNSLISNNLNHDYKYLKERNLYFELKEYIDEFLDSCNPNRSFIIPGIRGVGKTTLLYQLYKYLHDKKNIEENRILFLDLNRLKHKPEFNLLDYLDVFIKDINDEYYLTDMPIFILIDETQYAKDWNLTAKTMYDENSNVLIIFTGSNALNLELTADTLRRSLKKQMYPLNFSEYMELNYNINITYDFTDIIFEMLITGHINEIEKIEKKLQLNEYKILKHNVKKEFEYFLEYGDLPVTILKNKIDSIQTTLEVSDKIIETDMDLISSIKSETRLKAYELILLLATVKPGEMAVNKIANNIQTSTKTIENLLKILKKTELIFPIEIYGSPSKQSRTPTKYYFLSTQTKAAFFLSEGDLSRDTRQSLGILAENMVASTLHRIKETKKNKTGIYYDSRKGGVDFIITSMNGNVIPIEVGIGKKNKKQITKAINYYKSDYGVVISNKTNFITKEDKIIFIPLSTFGLA